MALHEARWNCLRFLYVPNNLSCTSPGHVPNTSPSCPQCPVFGPEQHFWPTTGYVNICWVTCPRGRELIESRSALSHQKLGASSSNPPLTTHDTPHLPTSHGIPDQSSSHSIQDLSWCIMASSNLPLIRPIACKRQCCRWCRLVCKLHRIMVSGWWRRFPPTSLQ